MNGNPDAFLCLVSGHTAEVSVFLHKSYGASFIQAQAGEKKAWGFSLPCCPIADTTHMSSGAQQFLLLLSVWCVGSECQGRITSRKGNRWKLMLHFPAKCPAKLIWLILHIRMLRTLAYEALGNTETNYHGTESLSEELHHLPV